jgi:hypothetical protein
MTTTPITGQVFGEEQARDPTHAFLQSEAQKPFSELLPAVVGARVKLVAALQGVNDAQAHFRPAGAGEGEEGWPIALIVQHVTGAEGRLTLRLRALGGGEEMPAVAPGPPTDNGQPMSALLSALAASRVAMLAAMKTIDGKERLDTMAKHPFFGEMNCRAWFRLQGLHEEDHARQIEGIKAHPDYPKS